MGTNKRVLVRRSPDRRSPVRKSPVRRSLLRTSPVRTKAPQRQEVCDVVPGHEDVRPGGEVREVLASVVPRRRRPSPATQFCRGLRRSGAPHAERLRAGQPPQRQEVRDVVPGHEDVRTGGEVREVLGFPPTPRCTTAGTEGAFRHSLETRKGLGQMIVLTYVP